MDGNALVLCEGALGTPSGKTANGLVRFTERYRILGVIDSTHAGRDAGEVLEGRPRGIPVVRNLEEALRRIEQPVHYLVIGIAPDGGMLPAEYRSFVKNAIRNRLNIDSGLHEFLSEDPEFGPMAKEYHVQIRDVRKPPPREKLHFFTGKIEEVKAAKIAVLGTDSAVGKRTTAILLTQALRQEGLNAELIGTGQTAWMQGVKYGIILDSIVNDFVTGEIEHIICQAWAHEKPDVIVLEGQGSLLHPAYPGGFELIAAGRPDGIVLQTAPKRKTYDGFPHYPIAPLEKEIQALELISGKPILALTLNHEGMTDAEITKTEREYEKKYGVPCCDVLKEGGGKIVAKMREVFPVLRG